MMIFGTWVVCSVVIEKLARGAVKIWKWAETYIIYDYDMRCHKVTFTRENYIRKMLIWQICIWRKYIQDIFIEKYIILEIITWRIYKRKIYIWRTWLIDCTCICYLMRSNFGVLVASYLYHWLIIVAIIIICFILFCTL